MSFARGNISFNIVRIVGDPYPRGEVDSAASRLQYAPLEANETRRVSVVDPFVELESDLARPYCSPVSERYVMFDVVLDERVFNPKTASKVTAERIAEETRRMGLTRIRWKMSDERKLALRAEVERELAAEASPTRTRTSVIVDFQEKILVTSAKNGSAMDLVVEACRVLLGEKCLFVDHLSYDFEVSKTRIVPFGISNEQSKPPKDRVQWLRELTTWMAAKSITHDGDIETDDMMKVSFPGKNGKTMSVKTEATSEIDDFCAQSLAGGGVVRELTMYLAGDFFRTRSSEMRFKINSSGFISGILPMIKNGDRLRKAWLIAEGTCAIASKIGEMARNFIELRKSAREWGTESAKIRQMLKTRKESV